MILYIIYNADLLSIAGDVDSEDSLGFVDDIAILAIGKDFEENARTLKSMMEREGGGQQWSNEHNSKFEISKSAVLHLTRKIQKEWKGAYRWKRPP